MKHDNDRRGVNPRDIEIVTQKPAPDPKAPSQTSQPSGLQKGGEGGDATPFTPSNRAFIETIFDQVPEGARAAITAKAGDPQEGGWSAFDAEGVDARCTPNLNTYVNCASFFPVEADILARKEHAAAYHALVLDDVGTKVDRALLGKVQPTWVIETSPGNFQVGYKLSTPLTDPAAVERLQKAVADADLTDRGALGMARWVRLPNGINGKPKYENDDGASYRCILRSWNPETAYDAEELERLLVPKPETSRETVPGPASYDRPSSIGVFRDRLDENPVVTELKRRGLYIRELEPGKHQITCPWLPEHTDEIDSGTVYYEPSPDYPRGGFKCQHSHGDKYHLRELLDYLGLDLADARNRPVIRVTDGEMPAILDAAERQLAGLGDYYQAGSVIVTVQQDLAAGEARIEPVSEATLTLALSNSADWEKYDGRSKDWRRTDPPQRHVSLLYKAQHYHHLPELRGIARQPYFNDEGRLITKAGYDPQTRRLALFSAELYGGVGSTRADAEAALEELLSLLDEFRFANPVDRVAALAAILTAVVRPSLPVAPAFHVAAPSSGSGKSYLCEVISLFAGPGGSVRISYPRTSDEATKAILSALMTNPPVIEFDDMDIDWLPHGAINRMLTSPSITDRVLGVSKVATVRTQSLILGSGNNVGPVRDTLRRVVTVKINPRTEMPGTITYKGNPVAELRARREHYVTAALTIIQAFLGAGAPRTNVPSVASYNGAWGDYCRHPLIWLGLADPATAILTQMQSDPEADNLGRVFELWYDKFDETPVTLRKLLDNYDSELSEALEELPVMDRGQINRSRLGHLFKKNQDRIIGGYILQKAQSSERNAWRVVRSDDGPGKGEKGAPASPPSDQPTSESSMTAADLF